MHGNWWAFTVAGCHATVACNIYYILPLPQSLRLQVTVALKAQCRVLAACRLAFSSAPYGKLVSVFVSKLATAHTCSRSRRCVHVKHASFIAGVSAGLDEFLCEQLVEHCEASEDSTAGKGEAESETEGHQEL